MILFNFLLLLSIRLIKFNFYHKATNKIADINIIILSFSFFRKDEEKFNSLNFYGGS
jgi:hypothetical protein